MFSRSRSPLVRTAAFLMIATSLVITGCSKSGKKPEVRLAKTSMTADDSLNGTGTAWGPGGAPDAAGFGDGTSVSRGGDGFGNGASMTARDGSGSFLNDGNANGVENGVLSGELSMVHFAYDSTELTDDWKQVLNGHAQWLQTNSKINVQIEGHCDERGTEEYNIALGQRRADAVRSYLIEQGVDGGRITTISYGRLRPMNFEDTEQSHALNRRAMFLVFEGTQVASAGDVGF